MYKQKKWYDFLPPDRWLLITPSFWAFIAGALMSVAVNLLTGVRLTENASISKGVYLSTVLFFSSAAAFAGVSLILESSRAKVKPLTLRDEIRERKKFLSLLFLLGILCFILAMVFIQV